MDKKNFTNDKILYKHLKIHIINIFNRVTIKQTILIPRKITNFLRTLSLVFCWHNNSLNIKKNRYY